MRGKQAGSVYADQTAELQRLGSVETGSRREADVEWSQSASAWGGLDMDGYEEALVIYRAASGEFVGTALLVFGGCLSVVSASAANGRSQNGHAAHPPSQIGRMDGVGAAATVLVAGAFGGMVAVLMYLFARVSGAHLNPCVTLSLAIRGRITAKRATVYALAQLMGALLGAGLVKASVPSAVEMCMGATVLGTGVGAGGAVVIEAVLTFVLCLLYLARGPFDQLEVELGEVDVAQSSLALGLYYGVATLAALPLTGASMNPWRSLASNMFSVGSCDNGSQWVFWAGPVVGAVFAAFASGIWFSPPKVD